MSRSTIISQAQRARGHVPFFVITSNFEKILSRSENGRLSKAEEMRLILSLAQKRCSIRPFPTLMENPEMFRIAIFTAALFFASFSFAGDWLPIVFEESTSVQNGERIKCDIYYILIGDNNSFESGDLIQISQLHSDREHYGISKGRFTASEGLDRITINWPASNGQKYGLVEKARLTITDSNTLRFRYEIYQHDDESQVGQKMRARFVSYNRLPAWVQNAVKPSIIDSLSPQEQIMIHKMEAEQLRATFEICKNYLDTLK